MLTYLLTTTLVLLIFYGGAGVNLMSYCCNDCRSAGIEVVMNSKCCDIHQHNHCEDHMAVSDDTACEHLSEINCCSLERINFEWNQANVPVFDMQPVGHDLLTTGLPALYLLTDIGTWSKSHFITRDGPPLTVCPRVYLSLLTTLLI